MKGQTKTNAELPAKVSALKKKIRKLEKTEAAFKQAEAKLRESEARYRTIIETIQDGYMEVDLAGRYTFMNEVIFDHLGYSREELIGASITKFQDEANVNKTRQLYSQVFKTGNPCKSFELECIKKDGSRGIYELSVSLIRNAEGKPTGFRSISRDITERKKMENALKESENRYRMIVENMHDSIWTMDLDLNYTYLSPSEVRTSGYTPEEAMQIPLHRAMTPESYALAQRIFIKEWDREISSRPVDPHHKQTLELELYHKNGGTYWQETTASFIRNEDGKPTGMMFVGRDITEQKQAERDLQIARDQLLQAEKLAAIGQLSTGVAHEILNPVNIISMELQLLLAMDGISPDVREELNICLLQIDRVVAIADGLKQLARVHERKTDMVNINDVITHIAALHKSQLMIDKIDIDLQCHPDLPEIPMDRKRIEQVMMNLIANARAAMENKGAKALRIATGWEGRHHVRVMVADTGGGVKKEHRSQLFNPFFTTKEQGKGTGLGLSISYGILKDHGGSIWTENNEWGGASFYISLPVERTKEKKQANFKGEGS